MHSHKQTPLMACAALALLALLSGCARYQARPLNNLLRQRNSAQGKPGQIQLDYHIFSTHDCLEYLDRDLISAGYQPIHICLTNRSERYLHLNLANFNTPVLPLDQIAEEFHTNTLRKAVGYGAGAVFVFFPLAIPAIVDSVKSAKANKRLDRDFARKALSDCMLAPNSTVDGLIVVPTHRFTGEISIRLVDMNKNEQFILSSAQPWQTVC